MTFASTGEWLEKMEHPTAAPCRVCRGPTSRASTWQQVPELLSLSLTNRNMKISESCIVRIHNRPTTFVLRGVSYYGHDHFTSIIIDTRGQAWFHDGIVTGQTVRPLGDMQSLDLTQYEGRNASIAFYSLQI
jgi:hypothetical protein